MTHQQALRIQALASDDEEGIALVSSRMRATLMEVLGETRGREMYSMEWLRKRLLVHLDRKACRGEVLVARRGAGPLLGHTILRIEEAPPAPPFGLYSTTYVMPEARCQGIANALLDAGEAWLLAQGVKRLATDTASGNSKLIRLFQRRGYAVVHEADDMLRLAKDFN